MFPVKLGPVSEDCPDAVVISTIRGYSLVPRIEMPSAVIPGAISGGAPNPACALLRHPPRLPRGLR
jgi:hypothetical protein